MSFDSEFKKQLFSTTPKNFEKKALLLFRYQVENNPVYKQYVNLLNIDISQITSIVQIPHLPISFFKTQEVLTSKKEKEYVFHSSGTTGTNTSQHWVTDLNHYKKNTIQIFEHFYGKLSKYTILALLPSYLERTNSSLITMADLFINQSFSLDSGFYLYNHDELFEKLVKLKKEKTPTILLGVTFALLDFIAQHELEFPELIIMETGGMKGRKKELTRDEVHLLLQEKFPLSQIHSEYGMTELFSQFYSLERGVFSLPPWVHASTRELSDPFSNNEKNKQGVLKIIDLANVDSCAFLETEDIAKILPHNQLQILGRVDNSLLRGCNLLLN